ncbi:MAG: hypothetical protein KAT35_01745, partial [Candidatus Aenigmarchaeota archaeon]|nr:hypothetical protein [Candidatus Aenigmarchaeota archaeon]
TVATNLTAPPGENASYDARRQSGMDFTIPGSPSVFINITDGSGGPGYAKFSLYLDYIAGVHEFYLQEDNVTIIICNGGACSPASNTTVRRLGTQEAYLNIRIQDTDFGSYPSGIDTRFWLTEDFYNYTIPHDCTTVSGGYCEVSHDPGCDTQAGVQSWKLQTIDGCYQPVNSSGTSLDVYSQLYVNYTLPGDNDILNRNLTYPLNVTVNDDCGVYINDSDVTWQNESWVQINATSNGSLGHYERSWYIGESYELGPDTLNINTTKAYHDIGTNQTNILIYGWASIDGMWPPNGTEFDAGSLDSWITCHISDINTQQSIESYQVDFWKNGVHNNTDTTDVQGNATWYWYTEWEDAGYYNISCNITDDDTLYYNVSVGEAMSNVTVKRQLIIDEITKSYSIIYRNDSYVPHETEIGVHVNDAQIGNASDANVSFYNSSGFIDNCTTDSAGWCNITYNVTDTLTPGNYTIYINATTVGVSDSDTVETYIDVWGVLLLDILSPVNESQYGKTQTVTLNVNVTDEAGTVIAGTDVQWWNESSMLTDMQTYPNYPLTGQEAGNRTFTANASEQYYAAGNDSVIVIISAVADVHYISPPNYTLLPYPNPFDVICQVRYAEAAGGGAVDDYIVDLYYSWSGPWLYIGNFTTNSTGYKTYEFTPGQKGNLELKCNITDNSSRLITTGISEAQGIITLRDVIPPAITNISVVPNASIEANLNHTNITANITDDVGINSVWAQMIYPNGSQENVTMTNESLGGDLYRVTYAPAYDGRYTVYVWAQDMGPEYNNASVFAGYIDVWGKITGFIEVNQTILISGITHTQGGQFNLSVNFTNLGPPSAYSVYLQGMDEPNNTLVFNDTYESIGTMHVNETFTWSLTIDVPAATPPIIIKAVIYANWTDPDLILNSTMNWSNVFVSSNPILEIVEDSLTHTTPHEVSLYYIGNFTVYSSGNDAVEDIDIFMVGGNLSTGCPECVVDMIPSTWGRLEAGGQFISSIYVDVPAGQDPGEYWTIVRASASNTEEDDMMLTMNIPENKTWTRTPESFSSADSPTLALLNTTGVIGNITTHNIGNSRIVIKVYKTENGSDMILSDPEFFELGKQVTRNSSISYTIPTSKTQGMYYVKLLLRNDTADPVEWVTDLWLNVTDAPPLIEDVNVTPLIFEAGYENVSISAKITDNFEVDSAWIRVIRPGGVGYYNDSGMIHNAPGQGDSGFNHTEEITGITDPSMLHFNVTIVNNNGTTIYLNLTVNDVLVGENVSVPNGGNITIDAVQGGASFTLPGSH